MNKEYAKLFEVLALYKLKGPLQFALSKKVDCLEACVVADLAEIHVNNRTGAVFPNKTSYELWAKHQSLEW